VSVPTVKITDYDDFNSVILTLYCLSKILEESLLCHNSDFNMDIQKTWQARLKFLQIDESGQTKMAKKEVFISVDIELVIINDKTLYKRVLLFRGEKIIFKGIINKNYKNSTCNQIELNKIILRSMNEKLQCRM
jgi:hypothetical protein